MNKKYSKISLLAALTIMITVNMIQSNTNIAEALGISIVSILVWGVIGGFVIFNVLLAIYNLFKGGNELSFTWTDRVTYGLIVGSILKIFFNIKF